jgi:hypothetical protein
MRLFAQAAEIPEIFDAPLQLSNWAMVAVSGTVLLAIAALLAHRQRRLSRKPLPGNQLSPEA